jgi:hypothetical protein
MESVTIAFESVGLPFWSSTATSTDGANGAPATTLVGCEEKESCEGDVGMQVPSQYWLLVQQLGTLRSPQY